MLTAEGWPQVGSDETWLLDVMATAEEEARTRCDAVITDAHLGLAVARDTGSAAELLRAVGVDPLGWRDLMVTFMAYREKVGLGLEDLPDRWVLWRSRNIGDLAEPLAMRVHSDAAARIQLSVEQAAADGVAVAPVHLLTSLRRGSGYPSGCLPAKLTAKDLRQAAGLPHRPRLYAEGRGPNAARTSASGAPLVLLGGGTSEPAVYAAIGRIAAASRRGGGEDLRVAAVFAASPHGEGRPAILQHLAGTGAGHVVDSGLDHRSDAKDPRVVARLAEADVIYLDGGQPADLYDALWATPAYEAIVTAVEQGAVLVGSSAGTVVLGIRDSQRLDEDEPDRLFGWLRCLVFPHLRDNTVAALHTAHGNSREPRASECRTPALCSFCPAGRSCGRSGPAIRGSRECGSRSRAPIPSRFLRSPSTSSDPLGQRQDCDCCRRRFEGQLPGAQRSPRFT